MDQSDLNSKTFLELKNLAKENNIPFNSRIKKAELVNKLTDFYSSQETPQLNAQNEIPAKRESRSSSPLPTIINFNANNASTPVSNSFQNVSQDDNQTTSPQIAPVKRSRSPSPINVPVQRSRSPSPLVSSAHSSPKSKKVFQKKTLIFALIFILFIILISLPALCRNKE